MPLGIHWTPEEDEKLTRLVEKHGSKKWSVIAAELASKGSKQCRRRWKNFLNADLKTGGWSAQEDELLIQGHREHGNKWTEIAKMIGGRTDNAVKNRWAALSKRTGGKPSSRGAPASGSGLRKKRSYEGEGRGSRYCEPDDEDEEPPTLPSRPSTAASLRKRALDDDADALPGRPAKRPASRLGAAPRGAPAAAAQRSDTTAPPPPARPTRSTATTSSAGTSAGSPRHKRSDLLISIPNAAGVDPLQPSSLGLLSEGLGFKVMKELLTPFEAQYAKELNDMNLPLHIDLLDHLPPLSTTGGGLSTNGQLVSTSRARSSAAAGALPSPAVNEFQEIMKLFQSGLTPKVAPNQPHSFGTLTTCGNTPKGRLGSNFVPIRNSPRNRALPASGSGRAAQPAAPPPPTGGFLLQPSGSFHDGHRQLLTKLLTTAKSNEAPAAPPVIETATATHKAGGGPMSSRGSASGSGGGLSHYLPALASSRGRRGGPASTSAFAAGPSGLQRQSSRGRSGLAETPSLVMTPDFTPQELDMLLEALCTEEMSQLPPPPPLQSDGSVGGYFS